MERLNENEHERDEKREIQENIRRHAFQLKNQDGAEDEASASRFLVFILIDFNYDYMLHFGISRFDSKNSKNGK